MGKTTKEHFFLFFVCTCTERRRRPRSELHPRVVGCWRPRCDGDDAAVGIDFEAGLTVAGAALSYDDSASGEIFGVGKRSWDLMMNGWRSDYLSFFSVLRGESKTMHQRRFVVPLFTVDLRRTDVAIK